MQALEVFEKDCRHVQRRLTMDHHYHPWSAKKAVRQGSCLKIECLPSLTWFDTDWFCHSRIVRQCLENAATIITMRMWGRSNKSRTLLLYHYIMHVCIYDLHTLPETQGYTNVHNNINIIMVKRSCRSVHVHVHPWVSRLIVALWVRHGRIES